MNEITLKGKRVGSGQIAQEAETVLLHLLLCKVERVLAVPGGKTQEMLCLCCPEAGAHNVLGSAQG